MIDMSNGQILEVPRLTSNRYRYVVEAMPLHISSLGNSGSYFFASSLDVKLKGRYHLLCVGTVSGKSYTSRVMPDLAEAPTIILACAVIARYRDPSSFPAGMAEMMAWQMSMRSLASKP